MHLAEHQMGSDEPKHFSRKENGMRNGLENSEAVFLYVSRAKCFVCVALRFIDLFMVQQLTHNLLRLLRFSIEVQKRFVIWLFSFTTSILISRKELSISIVFIVAITSTLLTQYRTCVEEP